uniref:UDP-glucuronosyltransferase n=1 Tax=Scleropages formosus TaxID=113540 RepID=A0A8C9RSX3_SCLFO
MPPERLGGRGAGLTGLLLSILCADLAWAGKLLVIPADGSHWTGMKMMVEELGKRGNEVVLVMPEVSRSIGPAEHTTTLTYPVPYTKSQLQAIQMRNLDTLVAQDSSNLLKKIYSSYMTLQVMRNYTIVACESMLFNKEVMKILREYDFDAILTDPFEPLGVIVAEYLDLPSIYISGGLPCSVESVSSQCPYPPSYVPRRFTRFTDHMTLWQRIVNFLWTAIEPVACRWRYASIEELASRLLQRKTSMTEMMSHASLWFMRFDFTFEFPRPLMPNTVMIGGLNCEGSKPLPLELETFVNKSGDHGFVVFTLGSMVSQIPEEKAQLFLEAFRQIPQRVLWRYTGPTPANLPQNVKLMKWLPQNDLLGHPKARAFMTHGGTHGLYEGICNGVPMVMMPLFGDQGDNVQRMVTRGVGEVLNIHYTTSEEVVWALNKVINDTSYKEKIQKLSAIHKDRPIEPLDLAVHWTEFVMRHKGAEHLRPAAHNLNWFQYHSLDVIGLLLSVVAIVIAATVKSCTFCFRKCCRRKTQKKKKE